MPPQKLNSAKHPVPQKQVLNTLTKTRSMKIEIARAGQ